MNNEVYQGVMGSWFFTDCLQDCAKHGTAKLIVVPFSGKVMLMYQTSSDGPWNLLDTRDIPKSRLDSIGQETYPFVLELSPRMRSCNKDELGVKAGLSSKIKHVV